MIKFIFKNSKSLQNHQPFLFQNVFKNRFFVIQVSMRGNHWFTTWLQRQATSIKILPQQLVVTVSDWQCLLLYFRTVNTMKNVIRFRKYCIQGWIWTMRGPRLFDQ